MNKVIDELSKDVIGTCEEYHKKLKERKKSRLDVDIEQLVDQSMTKYKLKIDFMKKLIEKNEELNIMSIDRVTYSHYSRLVDKTNSVLNQNMKQIDIEKLVVDLNYKLNDEVREYNELNEEEKENLEELIFTGLKVREENPSEELEY